VEKVGRMLFGGGKSQRANARLHRVRSGETHVGKEGFSHVHVLSIESVISKIVDW